MRIYLSPGRFLPIFLAAVVITTFLKLTFEHRWLTIIGLSKLHQAPIYLLAALIVLVACSEWFRLSLGKLWHKRAYRSWWLPPGKGSVPPKTWEEVFGQTSFGWEEDPIHRTDRDEFRKSSKAEVLAYSALFVVTVCGFSMALDYIVDPHVPGLLFFQSDGNGDSSSINIGNLTQVSTNLTAYLAIITAGIALYVARFTLRAQVRSKSRQEWIDKFRSLIAKITSDINKNFDKEGSIDLGKINERIIHLELMLNLSEKDHRMLVLLLRACIHSKVPVEADINLKTQMESVDKCDIPKGSWDLRLTLPPGMPSV